MGTTAELSRIVHSGEEQRLGARKQVAQPVAVESTLGEAWLLDIGEGGIGISCPSQPDVASSAEVGFRLSESGTRIDMGGTVVWSHPCGRAGIRFTSLSPHSAALLKQWLAGSDTPPVVEGSMNYDPALAAQVASLADLAELQSTISAQQLDRDAALDLIVKRMAELTRATGAAIALREDQDVVCRASFGNAPDVGVKLSVTSLSGQCLRTGNLVLLQDSENDARVDPEICRQLNFRSLLILPVVSGSNRIGIAEVLSPTPHNFEGLDVLVVSFLADLIAGVSAPPAQEDEVPPGMDLGAREDAEPIDLASVPRNIENRVEQEVEKSVSPNLGSADATSPAAAFGLESAAVAPRHAAEEVAPAIQSELTRAKAQPIPGKKVGSLPRPADAVTPPRRLAPRKLSAISIGAAVLFVIALALAFYFWLHRNTVASKRGTPSLPAAGVASPPVLPSSPATSPSAPNPAANTPSGKAVRPAALREPATPSPSHTSSTLRELDLAQTATRTPRRPAVEAAPDAPALDQLTSTSSNALAAVVATKTPTPELGLVQSQGVTEGKLIKKVLPHYPELARRAGVTGDVVLSGVIGTDGKLKNLKVISGSPMLREEAVSAARQWRYTPYMLGSKPVETETHITINFHR